MGGEEGLQISRAGTSRAARRSNSLAAPMVPTRTDGTVLGGESEQPVGLRGDRYTLLGSMISQHRLNPTIRNKPQ